MRHPFLRPLKNFYWYLVAWALILATHTFLLFYTYQIPFIISLTDAIIFNLFLSALCLGIWYAVLFVKLDNDNTNKVVFNHIVTSLLFLGIWLKSCSLLLQQVFHDETLYLVFLKNSLALRFFGGLLCYSITILFYYLFIFYKSHKENQLKEANLLTLIKSSQLELLKSQLNPHFIFNSLNSISSLTMTDPQKAQTMVVKLSSFLRYSLGRKDTHLIALRNELDNCLLYLEIEQTRFGERLLFSNQISDACLECMVPDMILQPLMENAIKHGVYETMGKVHINLECHTSDGMCTITIANNYDTDLIPRPGKGIGLRNVADRLFLIYGTGDHMKVEFNDNTFLVTLNIPQKNG